MTKIAAWMSHTVRDSPTGWLLQETEMNAII
jgi:hypothetical protein